jgi:protein tyrosine phosphatase (PTP) superfamily phosphohydrolase (DUF442 family)
MIGRRVWTLAATLTLTGCCGTRTSLFQANRPACDNCNQPPVAGSRLTPIPAPPGAPPDGRFLPPQGGTPPAQLPPYTPPQPPPEPPPGQVGAIEPSFRPIRDDRANLPPRPAFDDRGPIAQVRLDGPVPLERAENPEAPAVAAKPMPPEPPVRPAAPARPETTEAAPLDIPQFVMVRERLATGQQPFPDGVAWLQSKGYRTVLHLRAPGEDNTAARRQFEKRGLTYVSLEVAPGQLTREMVQQFSALVSEENSLPMFVYDRDGSLTGGMWYAHFRLGGATEDKAVDEAKRLGLRPDNDPEHKTMLNAARSLLAQ